MSSSRSSPRFGEGWSECKGTSPRTSMSFVFLQSQEEATCMINLNYLLGCVMKSRRGRSKAVEICKNWSEETMSPFHFHKDDCYFDSRALETVVTLLHSEHMINLDHTQRILTSWKDVVHEFEMEKEEDLSDAKLPPLSGRTKRKRMKDEDAFDPIEDMEEDEFDEDAEDDVEEDFDEEDNRRPMEFEERERMIRLNCDTLLSLTAAGTYLMSRDPEQHIRTLQDIDASVVNVSRELQRFVPVGSQQPIQVEDVLDDEYAEKAVRLNRRARDLGHSLVNMNQNEYRSMLKDIGIRASNLHRQVYGRKPKKVRMMSGSGSTSHFNYYSERTAPRTLDVAIREWFTKRAKDAAFDEGMIELSYEDEAPQPQKKPRMSMVHQLEEENEAVAADQEEFDQLVQEAEEKCLDCSEPRAPGEELCMRCHDVANAEHEQRDHQPNPFFSQFFGNL